MSDSVAFIDIIGEIKPIEGADKIEQALVKGWSCIVPKSKYRVGDAIICITQDAVVPKELAESVGILNYLKHRKRTDEYSVRTVKLRGVYSECLILDTSTIPTTLPSIGKSVEDILNIHKYEEPEIIISVGSGQTKKYKKNPNFHVYYKFPNAKNAQGTFKEGDDVVITRKLHGSNGRWGVVKKTKLSLLDRIKILFGSKWAHYEFVYGSHRVEKGSDSQGYYTEDIWKKMSNDYDIKSRLLSLCKYLGKGRIGSGIILYGEVYGYGIQGEKYNYNIGNQKVAFFDIELNGEYLPDRGFTRAILIMYGNGIELPVVPYLYEGKWYKGLEEKLCLNQYIDGTKTPHEGIVVKSMDGSRAKIYKVINPEYLIFADKNDVPDSH